MTLFWDYDGPILDVSERYWLIHRDIMAEFGRPSFKKDEYWAMKRQGMLESDVLEKLGSSDIVTEYRRRRQGIIEEREYLIHDRLQKGAYEALNRFRERPGNVLATLRWNRENLLWQLDHLGIADMFLDVLSTGEEKIPRWRMKYDLMGSYLDYNGKGHVIITDTDTDIRSGKELGMFTIGISNGIRGPQVLKEEGPDILLENTHELLLDGVIGILDGWDR